MDKILLLSTTRWNPIIQMSDGVKNKFERVDGRPLPKGKNIYFFQQEFYEMLKDKVRTVMVAEDLTDTPEEFHINELWDRDTDAFKTIDMGWRYSWQ